MYKAVLFDFFGVFCTPMATSWSKKAMPDDAAKQTALQALCKQSDLGKLTRQEFDAAAAQLAGLTAPEVTRGIDAEIAINNSLVAYVRELTDRGYRIACLTNSGREWAPRVIEQHGLADLFEAVIISADLEIVKSSPEIYTYTLEKMQLPAAQTIFVDDRKGNVDAAEACGMRGLVFSDTPAFITAFEALTKPKPGVL